MKDGYQSLVVWQKSLLLAKEVYIVIASLPKEERYGLGDQMRRAVVSVPSNIAEGSRRGSKKEFRQFLHIAHGSLAEIETQLVLAKDLYRGVKTEPARAIADEVGRLLYGLIRKLES